MFPRRMFRFLLALGCVLGMGCVLGIPFVAEVFEVERLKGIIKEPVEKA